MQEQKYTFGLSSVTLVIILGATAKFVLHMFTAPGYGFFSDELYTIALSRHLAFGYVDLPPLVPAMVALSRALLGESLFALHIFPAFAGSVTLVFVCLITKEFGGRAFAVGLSALGFIVVPFWLAIDSIFCYDSVDQMVLASFLYVLVRFLRTGDRRLWILLGLIAGIACMTKMTLLFLGPGFLIALLISKYRRDLLTPCPWLGALTCVIIVSPYLFWQAINHWPTLEYWTSYGTQRVYQATLLEYLTNLFMYMGVLLLPLWILGLYRIWRRLNGVDYSFLGVLFVNTFVLMFVLHTSTRMLAELFVPLLAASAVFMEEMFMGLRWERWMKAGAVAYLVAVGVVVIPLSLPILPMDATAKFADTFKPLYRPVKEFNGVTFVHSPLLSGRLGWEELVREVGGVYDALPEAERTVAGIYTDWYMSAGAIDQLGPQYGLPHAVSGSLTYYLWGPGYSWDVMIIVSEHPNTVALFFDECELKGTVQHQYDPPVGRPTILVCRSPKVSPDVFWPNMKSYR
ncbi:MAG: glycosyltransferase family 39 protein [Anaerolineales bacterium]|nr:glycosyltransferase family 39 protein [Anaerolineales bacterium]